MKTDTEIHQPAARKEAQYRCISCGEDRFCNCFAPAIEKAAAALAANPGKSNRAIAAETGVSEPTVRRARASSDAPETVTGKDGKSYPAKKPAHNPVAEGEARKAENAAKFGEPDVEKLAQALIGGIVIGLEPCKKCESSAFVNGAGFVAHVFGILDRVSEKTRRDHFVLPLFHALLIKYQDDINAIVVEHENRAAK